MHDHAGWCIIPRWLTSASSAPRGSPGPSCCGSPRSIPTSTCGWPRATRQAGTRAADLYPSLAAAYPSLMFTSYDPAALAGLDLVFLGLPARRQPGDRPELVGKVGHVVDLAADFRLQDPALYPQWYGEAHTAPELLARLRATACPSSSATEIRAKAHVAVPGCYPTAASLALAPARAGRRWSRPRASSSTPPAACPAPVGPPSPPRPSAPSTRTSPPTACSTTATPRRSSRSASARAGAVHAAPGPDEPGHPRHLLRPPHGRDRAPPRCSTLLRDGLRRRDASSWCIDGSPSTKATLGSNTAHVTARFDERTGWVVAIAAIDNLTKGASGQAVQCANLLLGLPEADRPPDRGGLPLMPITAAQRGSWPPASPAGIKASGDPDLSPGGHRRRRTGRRGRRVHPQQDDGGTGPVTTARHLGRTGGRAVGA